MTHPYSSWVTHHLPAFIFAKLFNGEEGVLRPQIISGACRLEFRSHCVSNCYFVLLHIFYNGPKLHSCKLYSFKILFVRLLCDAVVSLEILKRSQLSKAFDACQTQ